MHPFIEQSIAADRMRELQQEAAAARMARLARRGAPPKGLRKLARAVAGVVAECNDAQRRLLVRTAATDRYLAEPRRAPDTYAEFLARTSTSLLREPTADLRLSGDCVR